MNDLSFLAAIREDPGDDVPRLVYADWLEDHGNSERAEFIRIQIELARGVRDRGRSMELLRHWRELLQKHRADWLGPLRRLAPDAIFERGFVDHISVAAAPFLDHAEELFQTHPIRSVRFRATAEILTDLFLCPHLAALDLIDLEGEPLQDLGLLLLGRCEHLSRLRNLNLSNTQSTATGLRQMLANRRLDKLEVLALRGIHLAQTSHEESFLLSLLPLTNLRQLDLSMTGVNAEAFHLLAVRGLSQLRGLRLGNNPDIDMAVVEALLNSSNLKYLEVLDVSSCGLSDDERESARRRFGSRVLV